MREPTYVELLGGERATTNTSSVCLDDTNRSPDDLWRYPKAGANTTNGGRGGGHIRIRPEVDIEHQRICALYKNLFMCCQSTMNIRNTVYDERFQPFGQVLQGNAIVRDGILSFHVGPALYRMISPSVSYSK